MTILTHNWPGHPTPNAGIWLKRVFDGSPVITVGKRRGWFKAWRQARQSLEPVVACWTFPAGLIAFLSGRPYVLYAIGLDVFWMKKSRLFSLLATPILRRARQIVFCSEHGEAAFMSRFGRDYEHKSRIIRFPVEVDKL
jgi:hypothetical protein